MVLINIRYIFKNTCQNGENVDVLKENVDVLKENVDVLKENVDVFRESQI
jgi:hypothetical protein